MVLIFRKNPFFFGSSISTVKSVMRKDNPEPKEMEEPSTLDESNPVLDDILHESGGNFGIVMKEENISDVEPDDLLRGSEDQGSEEDAGVEIVSQSTVPDVVASNTPGTCGQNSGSDAVAPGTSGQTVKAGTFPLGTISSSVLMKAIKKRTALAALVKREEEWRVKFMPNNSDQIPKCTHDVKYRKVTRKKLKCSECKSSLCPICHCILISTVQNHFSKSDNNNKYYYPCRLCHMLFRSNCALKAHLLIHALDTPYVCPDCGSVYNNIHYLSLHLINKCNHVYKIVKSGCKLCKSPNMAPAEYMAHIEQAHITRIHKCSLCGLMFEASSDIERHLKNSHRQEKATCRSYFCCTLCGNLIISGEIYGRHMRFHLEFSGAFEIGYLCPCARSFSALVDFRAHSQGCSQKGVLPQHWTYLQVTLRPNEMLQIQNEIENRALRDSDDAGTDGNSSDELERLFEDGVSSTSFSDASTNHTVADQSRGTEDETRSSSSEITFRDFIRNTPGVTIEVDESGSKFIVQKRSGKSFFSQRKRYEFVEKRSSSDAGPAQSVPEDKGSSSDLEDDDTLVSPSGGNDEYFEEISSEFQDENASPSEQENENENIQLEDEDIENNVEETLYDYDVPSGHYYYVDNQQNSEFGEENATNALEESPNENRQTSQKKSPKPAGTDEPTPGPSHSAAANGSGANTVLVTSVLDQIAGAMNSIQGSEHGRKKPFQSGMNPGRGNDPQSRDARAKSSTFFSCPFCSVLFPKHSSSFQKFRLHMERYHQDACLDIDVDTSDTPKSQMQYTSITATDDSENDSSDLDDMDLQTRFEILGPEEEDDASYVSSSSVNSGNMMRKPKKWTWRKERLLANKNRGKQVRKDDVEKKPMNSENRDDDENQRYQNKGDEQGNRNGAGKRTNKNGRSSKRSKNRRKRHAAKKKINESSASQAKPSSVQNIEESGNSDSSDESSVKLNTPDRDVADGAPIEDIACDSNSRELEDENDSVSSREMAGNLESAENATAEEDKTGKVNRRRKATNNDDGHDAPESESEEEARNELRNVSESDRDSMSCCSKDTLDKEPYSPESSKTPTRDMDSDSQNAENLNETDDREVEPDSSTERKGSQKEGDLWSNFYKSLNVAESPKKTNEGNSGKSGEEVSSSVGHTRKRVVEKPKRYRHNTDTEESENEEQSGSSLKSDDDEDGQNDDGDDDDETDIDTETLIRCVEDVDNGFILVGVVNGHGEDKESHVPAAKNTDGTLQNSNEGKHTEAESEVVAESGVQVEKKDEEQKVKKVKKFKNRGKKDKNKEKKDNDKDKNDRDQDKNGKDQDKNDRDQDRNEKDKDQDSNEKDQDKNGKDKDGDEKKRDKKDKDEDKGKERDKDQKKDGDKDEDDEDKNEDENENENDGKSKGKVVNSVNAAERDTDTGDRSAEKKRVRRKRTEPLSVRELRRSDLRGASNSADKNSESDSSEFSTSKKKRKVAPRAQHKRVSVSPERNEFSSGQVITTRSHGAEKKLTCAVCKETLPNRQEFRDHIQNHRDDDNNYQCMDCGECFVVRPSLEKHLHAYHKVKDVKKYIEENGCSAAEANEESDTEPLKENQCRVCRDEFDTAQDLNKHFRIHGMAFLEQVKREARAHHTK